MTTDTLWKRMDECGAAQQPFVFSVDYEMKEAYFSDSPMDDCGFYWEIDGIGNRSHVNGVDAKKELTFGSTPIDYEEYKRKFKVIQRHLHDGNTFLANLTVPTPIEMNMSLEEVFLRSNARFKICVPERFVCFSPEIFVDISNTGRISSNPMKGTIKGCVENAEDVILRDYKETAEHHTIVDFIRSDLSRVASGVCVDRLRYIDRLMTTNGEILQVSSEISAVLPYGWQSELGHIFRELLPAGSISGAPKGPTVEAIAEAESEERGFYTGVFGYYDGKRMRSAVMIRYIEQTKDGKHKFRSGGGITINSKCRNEYEEVIEKVYLAI